MLWHVVTFSKERILDVYTRNTREEALTVAETLVREEYEEEDWMVEADRQTMRENCEAALETLRAKDDYRDSLHSGAYRIQIAQGCDL